MRYIHISHLVHRVFRIKRELREIYLNIALLIFAIALVGIYIPIQLIVSGFSLTEVLYFYLAAWLLQTVFSPLAAMFASRIGFKYTIFLRSPTLIILLALVAFVNPAGMVPAYRAAFLMLLAAVASFSASVYWTMINMEFVKHSDAIHEGEEIGYLYAVAHIAAVIAPFAGGIILVSGGFYLLFIIVSFIIIFSVSPLFMINEFKGSIKFSFSIKETLSKRPLSMLFLAQAVLLASENIMWPVFVFFKMDSVLSVGAAVSFAAAGIALLTVFIGEVTDRIGKKALLKIGGTFYPFIWLSRILASTPLEIFILSFLGGLVYMMITIPVFAIFCDSSRKNPINGSVFREIWLAIGKSILMGALIITGGLLEVSFAASILSSLFILFMAFKNKI